MLTPAIAISLATLVLSFTISAAFVAANGGLSMPSAAIVSRAPASSPSLVAAAPSSAVAATIGAIGRRAGRDAEPDRRERVAGGDAVTVPDAHDVAHAGRDSRSRRRSPRRSRPRPGSRS